VFAGPSGSRKSFLACNTIREAQKLFEICKKECENTYYIQTIKDLDLTRLKSTDNVGITAGASTPNNIIEEVQKNVRNEF
jgi:4-hydroxy-3-methylbut-2-enyl diphosphate reductase